MMDLAPFVGGDGEEGYVGMYMDVLDKYQGSFREVLRSVRDRPGEAILFHCTGKCTAFHLLFRHSWSIHAPLTHSGRIPRN